MFSDCFQEVVAIEIPESDTAPMVLCNSVSISLILSVALAIATPYSRLSFLYLLRSALKSLQRKDFREF
jgi:hypothetical protein